MMEIGLHLEQTQKLIITPELRQALEILQLSSMDLVDFTDQALMENPLLEAKEGGERNGEQQDEPNRIDWQSFISKSRDYYEEKGLPREVREEGPHESMVSHQLTLEEYLTAQWKFAASDPEIGVIGEYLIGNMNPSGYLAITVEQAAADLAKSQEKVEQALKLLQTMDPPGVCARSLRECLILQVVRQPLEKRTKAAMETLINHYLQEVGRGNLVKVAKEMELTPAQVQKLVDRLRRLNPKPGVGFADSEETVYVIPDVQVERDGEGFRIILNEGHVPQLTINDTYAKVLLQHSDAEKDQAAKSFVEAKLNQAAWLLRCLEQRRSTIYKVTEALLKYQVEFFRKGVSALRPLTMRQIADEVGVHESTVSRTAANKYIQTPHGVFEFKFFFTPGLESVTQGTVSTESIREIIKGIIKNEEPEKPFTDQQIADQLGQRGIKVARRTVAKYREELGIRSTALRRRY